MVCCEQSVKGWNHMIRQRSIRMCRRCLVYLIVMLLFGVVAPLAAAEFFRAADYYLLLRDFKRALELPETTVRERELKIANLTHTYSLRTSPDSGITTRARLLWDSVSGFEMREGTPKSLVGSAGTEPKHGYRPRLIDLYANWKAASLVANPEIRSRMYRNMLAALPPDLDAPTCAPYIYHSPIIHALVAEARICLDDHAAQAISQWQRVEVDELGTDRLLRQLMNDLKPGRNSPQLDNTVTDAIALAIYRDYLRIRRELSPALCARQDQPSSGQ